jgi:hypothetical protein
MTFASELQRGFDQPVRRNHVNRWGEATLRSAERLQLHRRDMPREVEMTLDDLFFEIGRLCRDAEIKR